MNKKGFRVEWTDREQDDVIATAHLMESSDSFATKNPQTNPVELAPWHAHKAPSQHFSRTIRSRYFCPNNNSRNGQSLLQNQHGVDTNTSTLLHGYPRTLPLNLCNPNLQMLNPANPTPRLSTRQRQHQQILPQPNVAITPPQTQFVLDFHLPVQHCARSLPIEPLFFLPQPGLTQRSVVHLEFMDWIVYWCGFCFRRFEIGGL